MHVGLANLDCGRSRRSVIPLKLQLALPQEVDQDVDADVDRCADQEEEQPHINELRWKKIHPFVLHYFTDKGRSIEEEVDV